MQVAKGQIVEFFMRRNEVETAQRADETLPAQVDLSEHAETLRALGIDPGLLATQIDNLEA